MSEKIAKVLSNVTQSLTTEEQATARTNIGAQGALTAGDNVSIVNDTISAVDTTYTAGDGISIDAHNVISASASPQVNTDWNASSGVAELLNKPNLAYKYASDTATTQLKGIQYGQNSNGDWHHQIIIGNGAMQSVGWGVPTRPSASANLALTTDSNGKMQWTAKPGQRITFTSSEATPYTRVSDILAEGNIPVYVSSSQGATRYYELIYGSSSYYTFVCNDWSQFGAKTYYVQVNSDNTITSGDMTSQTPLSFESPWLTNDNGTVKAKWPYGTCIGTINDRTSHTVTWTHGMTTTQFNQKLIDLPLPEAGLYVLYINGNGKYTDPSGASTSSQLLRFRVCNGYNTVAINTIDGLAQIPISANNLGFSCQLLVAAGSTPMNTLTLNVSNDDYEPPSGQNHTLTIQYLNVIWVRYPM